GRARARRVGADRGRERYHLAEDRRIDGRRKRGAGSIFVDGLGQGGAGAGGEVAVASVGCRDAVARDAQRGGPVRSLLHAVYHAERAGAEGGGPVVEGDRAARLARARRLGADRGRERYRLAEDP